MSEENKQPLTKEDFQSEFDKIFKELGNKKEGEEKPRPIKLKLDNRDYEYSDESELANAIAEMQKQAQEDARVLAENRFKELELEWAKKNAGNTQNTNTQPDRTKPDPAEIERLKDDPASLWSYMNQFSDQGKQLAQMQQIMNNFLVNQEINSFFGQHSELPKTEETSKVLANVLKTYGLPPTAQYLELAYNQALNQGLLKKQEPKLSNLRGQEAPPSFGNSGSSFSAIDEDIASKLEDLSVEDLKKFAFKLQSR